MLRSKETPPLIVPNKPPGYVVPVIKEVVSRDKRVRDARNDQVTIEQTEQTEQTEQQSTTEHHRARQSTLLPLCI